MERMEQTRTRRRMGDSHEWLLGLQQLDEQMEEARDRVRRFGPELEELEAPVQARSRRWTR
jgi:hypothetical protein